VTTIFATHTECEISNATGVHTVERNPGLLERLVLVNNQGYARNNIPVLHLGFSLSLPETPGFGARSSITKARNRTTIPVLYVQTERTNTD